jgi:sterol desaturase/sphingolipid hydroxylase (fatty acid hydroxylase superfamily)
VTSSFVLRTICYLTVLLVLLGCERLFPYVPSVQKKSFRVLFHLGLSIANSAVLYLIVTGPLLASISFGERHGAGLSRLLGLNGWSEIAATVLVFDFWDYWMHRANHRIPFLWRFHRAHHSDMELDVTTASRFHLGELLISATVKGGVILLWGPSLVGMVLFDAFLTAASQLHHANLAIPFPVQDVMEKVVVTPRMHRCHHSLQSPCYLSNYSAILSAWDRLFRSYHCPSTADELAPIGISSPRGPVTMQLKPFLLTPFDGK